MSKNYSFTLILKGIFISLFAVSFISACKSSKTAIQPSNDPQIQDSKAQSKGSLLWKISGNDLKQVSYLFGTIHIIGENDFFMTDEIRQAFGSTQQLALELDMDDPKMMMSMMAKSMMSDGKSLKDLVSEEDYSQANRFFKDTVGMGLALLNKMKPMLLASMIYPKMLDGKTMSYEQEFVKMAKKQDMEVLGVESLDTQLDMIDKIPLEDQAEMLMQYIRDFTKEKNRAKEMIALYTSQDLEGLYNFTTESPEIEEFKSIMLDDRNQNWIPVMENMAKEMPTFFAVGAGHLWGEMGVINLLKEAGYEVTSVR